MQGGEEHGAGSWDGCGTGGLAPAPPEWGPGAGGAGQPTIPKVSHGWQGVGARTFPDPNKRDQKKSNVNLGCQNMQVGHCQVSVS